jgi:serine O-acetyltransferase
VTGSQVVSPNGKEPWDVPLAELIRADLDQGRFWWREKFVGHLFPNVFVVLTYRIAHWIYNTRLRPLSYVISILCQVITGAELRPGARIGPGFVVMHPIGVSIGTEVLAGRNFTVFGKNSIGYAKNSLGRDRRPDQRAEGSPIIGDNVRVGTLASLLGPITIGDNVQIGAHSLVVKDVPDGGRTKAPQAEISGPRQRVDSPDPELESVEDS